MIATSQDYKDQIAEKVQRWSVDAKIDYSDYNIDNDITGVQNNPDITSDPIQLADGVELPTYEWFYFRNFAWGRHLRSEQSTSNEKAGLSSVVSDEQGNFNQVSGGHFGSAFFGETVFSDFVNYPTFDVNFVGRTVNSIKVIFDGKLGEWAEEFDINVYQGTVLAHTEAVTGHSSYRYEKDISSVLGATCVQVVVKKWSYPGEKAKVIETFTSVSESYDSDDIEYIKIIEESISTEALRPIGNFSANQVEMKLVNIDNKFDNDNENSPLKNKVTKNRRVQPTCQLNDLTDDKIPLGTFYTTQWDVKNEQISAELTAQDVAGLMGESEYTKSQFIIPGSPQQFIYTTTAEFALFIRDNADAENNELIFGGDSVKCDSSLTPTTHFGSIFFGSAFFENSTYCGTADKEISFTYTAGTTVNVSLVVDDTIPTGTEIQYFYSKDGTSFTQIENKSFSFVPDDPTDTSQLITIRCFFITNDLSSRPSIQELTVDFTETVSLYSLAALVIDDFDNETSLIEGNYYIDLKLADQQVENAFFDPKTHREALQEICEAGAANAYIARNGQLRVESITSLGTAVKAFDRDSYADKVNPSNNQRLFNRVIVNVNEIDKVTAAQDIGRLKIKINDGDTVTYTVKFKESPAENITLSYDPSLPAGVTLDNQVNYTWGTELTYSNASGSQQEFTVEIQGRYYQVKSIERYQQDNTESIRQNGVIELKINNPLIQSRDQAVYVADLIIDSFAEQKREIEIDIPIDPALEIDDTITVDSEGYKVRQNVLNFERGKITHELKGSK